MLLCPKSGTCPPKLLCMRYYRAISDGWRDDRNCPRCVEDYRPTMRDLTGCQAPGICHCKFCVRQPPSLRDLASHTLFKLKFDISKFELTVHSTFREYAYDVSSGMVDIDRLLPPEHPSIRLWFSCDRFVDKYQQTCPNDGPWDNRMASEYTSRGAALRTLSVCKDRFWCRHCERGLFFPRSCSIHPRPRSPSLPSYPLLITLSFVLAEDES